MIKFFRRIRQRLLISGQLKKYFFYALGEILLVVIGILIALQINNWNEGRKEIKKERAVLLSLQKDFEQNKIALTESIKTYPENIGRLTAALKYLGTDVLLSEEMKDTVFNTDYHSTAVVEGTLNSVLSTDKLELISNDSLKQLLTAYPAEIDKFKSQEANVKRIVLEIHRPVLESYITLGGYISKYDMFAHLKGHFVPSDFEGLLKDKKYQNALVDRLLQSNNLVRKAERFLEINNNVLALIKSEISKNSSK